MQLDKINQPKPDAYHFSGKWITPKGQIHPGQWFNFRKTFDLTAVPDTATLRLTVESKYWLWINGQLVVYEGQLKNGPAPHSAYFDELAIEKYLLPGKNVIALLTVYFGKNGYGFFDGGTAGLILDADFGTAGTLESDETWVAISNPAYHESMPQKDRSYRLAEPDINYVATDAIPDWQMFDFDDREWPHVITQPMPFKSVIKRPIPQLFVGPINRYQAVGTTDNPKTWSRSDDAHNPDAYRYAITNTTNRQGTAYLKVIAPADRQIDIYTDTWKEAANHGDSVRHVYHTRAGVQAFEALGWFNGYQIFFEIPKDVTVLELGFRPSGYATKPNLSFKSDSLFMNKLMKKSRDTLAVTMRDTYMDCPDRERAQWIGDAVIEMEMAFYGMDENARLLYKKAMYQALNFQHSSGAIPTTAPNGIDPPNLDAHGNLKQEIIDSGKGGGNFELPMQSLAFVNSFWNYYLYSGDQVPLEIGLPKLVKYLSLWKFDADKGLISHRGGTWDWMDWGSNPDARIIEQCWYDKACQAVLHIATLLNVSDDAAIQTLQQRHERIAAHFEDNFWSGDKHAYYFKTDDGHPDDRANALAVYAGLAEKKHRDDLINILESTFNSSPYMEKIVLESLYLLDADQVALQRTYDRYRQMVTDEFPTLWEFWQPNKGTRNHAWTGGPLIMMYRYNLGIRPLAGGYQRFKIRPHVAAFNHLEGQVPTPNGPITLAFNRQPDKTSLGFSYPDTVKEVEFDLPKQLIKDTVTLDGHVIYQYGERLDLPEHVAYLGSDVHYLKLKLSQPKEHTISIV